MPQRGISGLIPIRENPKKSEAGQHMSTKAGAVNVINPDTNQVASPERASEIMRNSRDMDDDCHEYEFCN